MTNPPAPPGFRTQPYTILNALQALIDYAGKPDTLEVGRRPTRIVTDMTNPPAPPGFRTQAYTVLNALQALIDYAGKPDKLEVGHRPTRIVTQIIHL